MTEIIYKKECFVLNGIFFKVHNKLNRFCREKQYSDELEELFKKEGIDYKREFELIKEFKDSPKGNRVDFIFEDKIIIEIKAKKFITKEDYFQIQRYLIASNCKLGLIVNFRNTFVKPKRVVNKFYQS